MKSSKARRFSDNSHGATSFVAAGAVLEGNLRGEGDYIICGEVHGDGRINGMVTVAESGLWQGNLIARNVLVSGRINGSIVANGQIEICASAVISGKVTGQAIAVGQGAVIDGELHTLHESDETYFEDNRTPLATESAA